MEPLPHRVRRLTFQVSATSPRQAFELQRDIRDQVGNTLIATMSRVFDESVPAGDVIEITRLRLDVRISGTGNVTDELLHGIERELRHCLTAQSHNASTPRGVGPLPKSSSGSVAARAAAGAAGDGRAYEKSQLQETSLRLLLHYLARGSLTWQLANLDKSLAVLELQDAAASMKPDVLGHLLSDRDSFDQRVAFCFRWLQLLPAERWSILAREALARAGSQSVQLGEFIGALALEPAGSISTYARTFFISWAIALGQADETANSAQAIALIRRALRGIARGSADGGEAKTQAPTHSNAPADAASHLQLGIGSTPSDEGRDRDDGALHPSQSQFESNEHAAETARGTLVAMAAHLPEHLLSQFERAIDGQVQLRRADIPQSSRAASSHPNPANGGQSSTSADGTASESASRFAQADAVLRASYASIPAIDLPRPSVGEAHLAPFGHWMQNAGLVLLHPFLTRFFEATSVKLPGQPALPPESLARAAALLHFLAVGHEDVFEFELDFIKLLLGLTLNTPLPICTGLMQPSDREEADQLLSSVIGHWRALKSTSVDGLRGSFLQRSGLLRPLDHSYRLEIELAPYDMLIELLPWGIGTVKLPWMKEAIFTEWPRP